MELKNLLTAFKNKQINREMTLTFTSLLKNPSNTHQNEFDMKLLKLFTIFTLINF